MATYSPAGQGDLVVEPSWRLTGADSGDFTIDRESGELTFRSIPDHERPADANRDNVYGFTVQVADGSYHGMLDVTVTVTAVNEPPSHHRKGQPEFPGEHPGHHPASTPTGPPTRRGTASPGIWTVWTRMTSTSPLTATGGAS